jgi:hypothetical protein
MPEGEIQCKPRTTSTNTRIMLAKIEWGRIFFKSLKKNRERTIRKSGIKTLADE